MGNVSCLTGLHILMRNMIGLQSEQLYKLEKRGNKMMNELDQTLTSLEVAEMVEKRHSDLIRDIRRYCNQLGESKIALSDFFTESTYQNEQNKTMPCYNITKKGCEFIAHKLTGTKGTAFTARYINRFYDMEQALQQNQTPQIGNFPPKSELLLRKSPTWFSRNNWKLKRICEYLNWERRYLYHKILNELSSIYNLERIESLYEERYGYPLEYKMDLMDFYKELGESAERYVEFLLAELNELVEP